MSTLTDEKADSAAPEDSATSTEPRRLAIRLSTAVTALTATLVIVVIATLTALLVSARGDLSTREAAAADEQHARQVALDYAVGASTIDYRDTKAWYGKLKADTTTQLAAKFDATSAQLDQILLPLQWTSKATPIAAVVTPESGGIYKVSAFLNVTTTSAQTPQGGQSTVTYALTIDKNAGWKITDVGGMDNALPAK
ncbi:hypothetical protein DFR70_114144 [Nocardia tenerifensis]|uniref:Mce-associated membrane protein n=1 Tax=Nocardia tenerifensis TaxID=228006 RepID=A0A318JXR6_9NOCA|nr:hypothetical protein [Nocardia tenerifensis]PXX58460.1 hypothetical protein DFR70_114144 [Nocardia tenerifensis]